MKRYRVKYKLTKEGKQIIKNTLIILIIIIVVFAITDLLKKSDDDFIESCTQAGYSIEHCIKNK